MRRSVELWRPLVKAAQGDADATPDPARASE